MSRVTVLVIAIVAFGLGVGAGTLGLLYATGGTGEPSRDTSEAVPTLSLNSVSPTAVPVDSYAEEFDEINGKIDLLLTQVADLNVSVTPIPAENSGESESQNSSNADTSTTSLQDERVLFRITEDESEVRFRIDEILMGNPTEVVGATKRVAGDIIINFSNPPASQLGVIGINARTLKTDNEFRDQSIRGLILQTENDEYEFIYFEPTALQNLSDTPVNVGDTFEFEIVGDLTIRDVTQSVTFDASVTIASSDRIEGTASTVVTREAFNLTINPPPTVSGIGDTVTLEIDFVALKQDE